MKINYNVETNAFGQEIIWYEKDGFRVSFMANPNNSDYQRYLNPEAEQFTPIVEVTQ
jgi:hypothetical protein